MFVAQDPTKIVILDQFAEKYQGVLGPRFPQVEFLTAGTAADAVPLMADARALFALAPVVTEELIAAGRRLEWIQALTTGVDTFAKIPSLSPDVAITSTRGVHGPQMAEMALMLMMTLSRDLPRMLANQQAQSWERWPQRMLWERTLAIVGVGTIAEALAERANAFGMTVNGVSSAVRDIPGFARVYAKADIEAAVADADFVVVLTPYSAQSHHMIHGGVFAAMRPDAYLINLARGGVVDEKALLEALNTGMIRGAALDVFEQEPLPASNPLWTAPNVIVTPHLGGMSEGYERQVLPTVEHNLRAFLAGNLAGMKNRVALAELV